MENMGFIIMHIQTLMLTKCWRKKVLGHYYYLKLETEIYSRKYTNKNLLQMYFICEMSNVFLSRLSCFQIVTYSSIHLYTYIILHILGNLQIFTDSCVCLNKVHLRNMLSLIQWVAQTRLRSFLSPSYCRNITEPQWLVCLSCRWSSFQPLLPYNSVLMVI